MEPLPLPGWTLRAHRSPVRTLGFAFDGLTCCSGDDEGWVVWWSLETRRPLAIWQAHDNALLTTEFWSSDELVTHGRDNKLRIWRLDRSQAYNTRPLALESAGDPSAPQQATPPGSARTAHPSSSQEAGTDAMAGDGTAKGGDMPQSVYAAETNILSAGESGQSTHYPKPWLVHAMDVNALNFCPAGLSPKSSQLAVPATIASERIDVYRLGEGLELTRPHKALNGSDILPLETTLSDEAAQTQRRGELGSVMALLFYDEQTLVAGYESGHLVTFDLTTGAPVWLTRPHRQPVLSLAAHEDTIWSTGADRTIGATSMSSRASQSAARLAHKGIAAIDVLPTDNLAVAARWDGTIIIFRIIGATDLEELAAFKGGRHAGITCARIKSVQSPSNRRRLRPLPSAWIAAGGKDGRVGLFGVPPQFKLDMQQRSSGQPSGES